VNGVGHDHAPGAEDLHRSIEQRAIVGIHVHRELARPHHPIAIVHAERRVRLGRGAKQPLTDFVVDAFDTVGGPARHDAAVDEHPVPAGLCRAGTPQQQEPEQHAHH
jgi:hypothetical protein